jgi:hypothetical protein
MWYCLSSPQFSMDAWTVDLECGVVLIDVFYGYPES